MKELYFYRVVMVCFVLGGTFLAGHHYGQTTIDQLADLTGQSRSNRHPDTTTLARVNLPSSQSRTADYTGTPRNRTPQNQFGNDHSRSNNNLRNNQPYQDGFQQHQGSRRFTTAQNHVQGHYRPSPVNPNLANFDQRPQPNQHPNQQQQANYNFRPIRGPVNSAPPIAQKPNNNQRLQIPLAAGRSQINQPVDSAQSMTLPAPQPLPQSMPQAKSRPISWEPMPATSTPQQYSPTQPTSAPEPTSKPTTATAAPPMDAVQEIVRIRKMLGGSGVEQIFNETDAADSSDSFRELLTIIASDGESDLSAENTAGKPLAEKESTQKANQPQKSAKTPKSPSQTRR